MEATLDPPLPLFPTKKRKYSSACGQVIVDLMKIIHSLYRFSFKQIFERCVVPGP